MTNAREINSVYMSQVQKLDGRCAEAPSGMEKAGQIALAGLQVLKRLTP